MSNNAVLVRGFVLASLFAGLFVLCVSYGALSPAPERGAYPSESNFLSNPDEHAGANVTTGGQVVDTDPIVLRVQTGGSVHELHIVETDATPDVGEKIRVFGTFEPERTVRAHKVVAVDQDALLYTKLVSAIAGIWVLVRILRHWRLFRERATLVPITDRHSAARIQEGDD